MPKNAAHPFSRNQGNSHPRVRHEFLAPVLLLISILLAGALTFSCLPIFQRALNGSFGGKPGIFPVIILFATGCMMIGALYAHALARLAHLRHQIGFHLIFWMIALHQSPFQRPFIDMPGKDQPIAELLLSLATQGGLTIVFLSTSMTLVSTWYTRTRGESAHDPYIMKGIFFFGGVLGLTFMVALGSAFFDVEALAATWSTAAIVIGGLLLVSSFSTIWSHPDAKTVLPVKTKPTDGRLLIIWVSYAGLGFGLPLSVSTRILDDTAGLTSLEWAPIILCFLAIFISFRPVGLIANKVMRYIYPVSLALLGITACAGLPESREMHAHFVMIGASCLISLHLFRHLFLARPEVERQSIFYLAILIGFFGASAFIAVLAPLGFDSVSETALFTLGAGAAPLLRVRTEGPASINWASLGVIMVVVLLMSADPVLLSMSFTPETLAFALAVAASFLTHRWFQGAGMALFSILIVISLILEDQGKDPILSYRDFTGTNTVLNTQYLRIRHKSGQLISVENAVGRDVWRFSDEAALGVLARSKSYAAAQAAGRPAVIGFSSQSLLPMLPRSKRVEIFEHATRLHPRLENNQFHVFKTDPRHRIREANPGYYGVIWVDLIAARGMLRDLITLEAIAEFSQALAPEGLIAFDVTFLSGGVVEALSSAAVQQGLQVQRIDRSVSIETLGNMPTSVLVMARGTHPLDLPTSSVVHTDPGLVWTDSMRPWGALLQFDME